MAPARRRLLREHRLAWQLRRCWDGSPFYRARLEAAGLDPATFNGLSDWQRLPILRATDLPRREGQAPASSWAVAPPEWAHVLRNQSSRPPRLLTDGDNIHEEDLVARALWEGGVRSATGGLTSFTSVTVDGIEWASVIIGGAGRIETSTSGVRGDPPGAHQAIWTDIWPRFDETDIYPVAAVAVTFTPTVAFTCADERRLHWIDDHFLIETVDPTSGEPVQEGEVGAVLLTDLTREGSPLLRYWTGLEAALSEEPCRCGRTSMHSRFVRRLS
ncbi:MAG: hypothetical protein U0893_25350 [Chloroflexota bacterium]